MFNIQDGGVDDAQPPKKKPKKPKEPQVVAATHTVEWEQFEVVVDDVGYVYSMPVLVDNPSNLAAGKCTRAYMPWWDTMELSRSRPKKADATSASNRNGNSSFIFK